uniref:Putative secreted protein n=1 Tax=Anopheles darlingi TaxID=43151 RepID=A0A2M4DGM3_ANODA
MLFHPARFGFRTPWTAAAAAAATAKVGHGLLLLTPKTASSFFAERVLGWEFGVSFFLFSFHLSGDYF